MIRVAGFLRVRPNRTRSHNPAQDGHYLTHRLSAVPVLIISWRHQR